MSDKRNHRSTSSNILFPDESAEKSYSDEKFQSEKVYSSIDADEASHQSSDKNYKKNSKVPFRQISGEKYSNQRVLSKPLEDFRPISPSSYCVSCISYSQMLEDLKLENKQLAEKCLATERHLKQYDNLLQIKDARLAQQESSLRVEQENLEIEKEKLLTEQATIADIRESLSKQEELIEIQNKEIEDRFRELQNSKSDLEIIIQEINSKSSILDLIESKKWSLEDEYSSRLADLESRENLLTENSAQSELKLATMTEEFYNIKAKFDEDAKIKLDFIQEQNEILTQNQMRLDDEKSQLEFTQINIEEELESIEILKDVLKSQQENLIKEEDLINEKYKEKFRELETTKQNLRKEIIYLLELIIENQYNSEESIIKIEIKQNFTDLEDLIAELKSQIEAFKNNFEKLRSSHNEIANKYFDLRANHEECESNKKLYLDNINMLEALLQNYEQQHLVSIPKIPADLDSLSNELDRNLKAVKFKEEELRLLENSLAAEKESVSLSAISVKILHEELEQEKISLVQEKIEFEKQKQRLFKLDQKQEEKAKLLIQKQSELLVYKEKLYERERQLKITQQRITTPSLDELNRYSADS